MSNQITLARFQTLAPSLGETEFAELVGQDGLDLDRGPGAGQVHISSSNAGASGLYDVRMNGSLLQHLSRQQVEHLNLAPNVTPAAAGTSSAPVAHLPSTNGTGPDELPDLEKKTKGNSTVQRTNVLYYEVQMSNVFISKLP
jgi:hypothetical protein